MDCRLVEDLFVLYHENELSPEIRKRVEEHLSKCQHCRNFYEKQSGFSSILIEEETEPLPKTMDQQVLLKLKMRRLKTRMIVGVLCIILVFLSIFGSYYYTSYIHSRKVVARDLQLIHNNINMIIDLNHRIKNDEITGEMIKDYADRRKKTVELSYAGKLLSKEQYNEEVRNAERIATNYLPSIIEETDEKIIEMQYISTIVQLDVLQRKLLPLHLQEREKNILENKTSNNYIFMSPNIIYLFQELEKKYNEGNWSEQDGEFVNQLDQALHRYQAVIYEESLRLYNVGNKGVSMNMFQPLNIEEMIKANQEVINLCYGYMKILNISNRL